MSFTFPLGLKRFIAQFLMPVPLVVEIFILGWALARFTRFKRTGMVCKIMSGCLFLAFSFGFGSHYIFQIERKYQPFDPSIIECENLRGCNILVLGQGMPTDSDLPIRYRVNATFCQRLFEGVRVSRLIPESQILVSMAGDAPLKDKDAFIKEFAGTVGLPKERFVLLNGARDTKEEVRLAHQLVRTNRLIVVSSATHIPRALEIARKQSISAIPSPCDYTRQVATNAVYSITALPLPSSHGFELSNKAAHEWLGSIYESLTR